MNLAVIPGTTGVAHRRGAEVGRACLGLPPPSLETVQAGCKAGHMASQQFCGQLEPQVNVHDFGETRVGR